MMTVDVWLEKYDRLEDNGDKDQNETYFLQEFLQTIGWKRLERNLVSYVEMRSKGNDFFFDSFECFI